MKNILFFSLFLLLTGCNTSQPVSPYQQPTWVLNPNQNGIKAATGSSMRTVDQRTSTQRTNAMVRALAELSNQLGVEVGSSSQLDCSVVNDVERCKHQNSIKASGTNKVTATAKAWWQDPSSGELFVWMVLD